MLRTLIDIAEVLLLAALLFLGVPALIYAAMLAGVMWGQP